MQGLWIGMIIGVLMQSLVLGYITFRTDWNEQVNHNEYIANTMMSMILINMNVIRMKIAFS
jgi:hypothetical protein